MIGNTTSHKHMMNYVEIGGHLGTIKFMCVNGLKRMWARSFTRVKS